MAFKKAVKAGEAKKYGATPLLDGGVYDARILSIVDLGMQPGSPQYPEPKPKLEFRFELLDEFMVGEDGSVDETAPRVFNYEVTYNEDGYMDEKANIYKLIAAIPAGFELELADMVGLPVTVMIQKYILKSGKNAGKEANKVTSVLPMKAKSIAIAGPLINKPLFFDLGEPDLAVWAKLYKGNPYAHQDRIMASTSFAGSLLQKMLGIEPTPPDDDSDQDNDDGFPENDADQDAQPPVDTTPEPALADSDDSGVDDDSPY
jgi:hypothetical protein